MRMGGTPRGQLDIIVGSKVVNAAEIILTSCFKVRGASNEKR